MTFPLLWLSMLFDILLKYLDKCTNIMLMTSADDTKLGNAVFMIKDADVSDGQME